MCEMHFLDLPYEILALFSEPLNSADLANLSQACTRLYFVFKPVVYRSLKLHFSRHKSRTRHNLRLWLLVRTFLENRKLGPQVEAIHFTGSRWDDADEEASRETCDLHCIATSVMDFHAMLRKPKCICQGSIKFSHEEIRMIDSFLFKELKVDHSWVWSAEIEVGGVDIFFTLLLALLPSIRVLELSRMWNINAPCLISLMSICTSIREQPFTQARPMLRPLSKLEVVNLTVNENEDGYTSDEYFNEDPASESQILHLLYLPSIRDLSIKPTEDFGATDHPLFQTSVYSALEILRIPASKACDERTLRELLLRAPYIQKLEFDACMKDPLSPRVGTEVTYEHGLSLSTLQYSLRPVSASLRSLTLVVSDGKLAAQNGPLSFEEFRELKHLEIPFVFFFGLHEQDEESGDLGSTPGNATAFDSVSADQLPGCLEHLCLTDDLANHTVYKWEPAHWLEKIGRVLTGVNHTNLGLIRLELKIQVNTTAWDCFTCNEWADWHETCHSSSIAFNALVAPRVQML